MNDQEYTGGSVSYYTVRVERPTNSDAVPYLAECNDIIEALGMNYAEGNAFKALWRRCAARNLGLAKLGYRDGLYDAEKVVFFGKRLVAQESLANTTPCEWLDAKDAERMLNEMREAEDVVIWPTEERIDVIGQNGNDAAAYLAKPEWSKAPSWAQWLAQSRRGVWNWFEHKPYASDEHDGWRINPPSWAVSRTQQASECHPTSGWRNTLERRP